MSTKLRDRQEKIEQITAKLVKGFTKDAIVVVGGKKDVINLKLLGV